MPADVAFDEAVRTTHRRVRASVSRFGESDDVVQEAYARAVGLRIPGDLEPWLRTVARRIAIDNARRRREFAAGDGADLEGLRTPSVATPEDVVVAKEGVGLIRRAVQSLPSRYRDALVAYSEHRDNTAVAARLGLTPNAVGSLLCRARMRLREELDRVGYAAGAVLVKFQRWSDVAATATATACFVAVMSGPSTAAPDPAAPPTTSAPAPVVRAVAARGPIVPLRGPAPRTAAPNVRGVHSIDPFADPVEIVRYEVEACTGSGRRIPTPYVTVVREGRRSVTGRIAEVLPPLPKLDHRACR